MTVPERQRRLVRLRIRCLRSRLLRRHRRTAVLLTADAVQPQRQALRPVVQYRGTYPGVVVEHPCLICAQQRQQQPIARAVYRGHRLRRRRQFCQCTQLLEVLVRVFPRAYHDELLLCTGHGYIQYPQLLRLGFPLQRQRQRRFGDGVVPQPAFHLHALRTNAQLGMDQHRPIQVLPVEAPVQVSQEHHRKLQSLGLMHAHQAHTARRTCSGNGRRIAAFQQLPYLPYTVKQTRSAALHKPPYIVIQCPQTRLTGCTVLHGTEDRLHPAAVIDIPQQLIGGQFPRHLPQLMQQRQKRLRVLTLILPQRLVIIPLTLYGPYLRQPVGAHAYQWRTQHRDQRHILPWVIHHLQQ